MSGDWDGSGYGWYLLPDWNKFVKRNRAEIDKRTEEIRSKRDNDARKKAEEEEEESRKQRQTVAPCINFGDPANLK